MDDFFVALGLAVALAADALAVIDGLPRLARRVRRWWRRAQARMRG